MEWRAGKRRSTRSSLARRSIIALGVAAQTSFRAVAALPAILLIVFGAIWLYDRSHGGFRAKKLS
ncbi:MAG: hypothetical protein WDO73_25560 [Ignavibacteriota bacterium]